jgi:hypothetical protein
MKRSLLELYALAVCFFTVICLVIALGVGLYDLVQIAQPEFTISAQTYERHQSNEAFASRAFISLIEPQTVPPEGASQDEITSLRQDSYQAVLRMERRQASQSATLVAIVLAIDIAIFYFHWRVAARARQMPQPNSGA